MPVRSRSAPKAMGRTKPPSPPIMPTRPADCADMVGVVDRDVLEDRRLAEAHEEAKREQGGDEGPQAHAGRKGDRAVLALDDVIRGG
jgi:hypothetical protein